MSGVMDGRARVVEKKKTRVLKRSPPLATPTTGLSFSSSFYRFYEKMWAQINFTLLHHVLTQKHKKSLPYVT